MNKILKSIFVAALAAAAVCSCSEWTTPESKKLTYPMVKDMNPELWQSYLKSLREYRKSDHKTVIAGFDNRDGVPSGRAELLTGLPDSIDFVVLANPSGLSDAVAADMKTIREEKGMLTLYTVSYENTAAAYEEYAAEWEASHQPDGDSETSGDDPGTPEGGDETPSEGETAMSRGEFIKASLSDTLSLYEKYGYDGIVVSFTGSSTLKMTEDEKTVERASQEEFFAPLKEWGAAHEDAVIMFSGKPQNLLSEEFLPLCRNIIIPAESAGSADKLSFLVRSAMGAGIPSDRFIIRVSAPQEKIGFFGDGRTAIEGAAEWVIAEDGTYSRAGVMILHSQKDYFNDVAYGNIRRAISIMNPTPKF